MANWTVVCVAMTLLPCLGAGAESDPARIALHPKQGTMEVIATVPALNGQGFHLCIPEAIGSREALWVNFMEAAVKWEGPDESGVLSCLWGPGGRIVYSVRLVPAHDYVDVEITVHNLTEYLWHDVFAFNCLNPVEAPDFQDRSLARTYMSERGKSTRLADTERVKGQIPTLQFYLPETTDEGSASIFVKGFGATSPNRTDGSWIATTAPEGNAYMAAYGAEVAFLFDNVDRCCIHAAPCFGDLGPGEHSTSVSRLYMAKGSLDDLLTRIEADRVELVSRQAWSRADDRDGVQSDPEDR